MLVELGNHAAKDGLDDRLKVTTIHIPEYDDGSTHDDAVYKLADGSESRLADLPDRRLPEDAELVQAGPCLGGYTHKPGAISVPDFNDHRLQAIDFRGGITQLPDHEILLACVNGWPHQSDDRPDWISVTSHEQATGDKLGHGPDVAKDVEGFLREFYGLSQSASKPADVELTHWTRFGAPGQAGPVALPDVQMLYLNSGRAISNINDGGGQVGTTGAATSTGATSLTNSGASWSANQWAGYRVYAQSSTSNMVWANVLSNTSTALTVDRWYAAATPGGSAGTTPSSTSPYMVADGGSVSSWFVALTSTNITPAATDTSLSGEITTAGGGLVRKQATYLQTSGTASRAITLTPVFTANGSDTLPVTVYAILVSVSMIVASTPLCGKFETTLNVSAPLNAPTDALTITETITGS